VISRILLRNWRGYEKLSLDLGPGLTFVIADNGVGKTSLINAAAWALFGEDSGVDGPAAIRVGSPETTVEVDFALGDAELSVRRSRRREGRGRETVEAAIDRRAASADELRARLAEAAALPYEILSQLMFVPEMQLTHEGELFGDVQGHLSGLLGIDHLRQAAATARQVHAAVSREVRTIREQVRADEAVLVAARTVVEEADAEIARIDAAVLDGLARRDELDAARRAAEMWRVYDIARDTYETALARLLEDAAGIGVDLGPGDDVDALVHAEQEVLDRTQEVQRALASVEAEGAVVRDQLGQLESAADAVCPVCRRPIDEDVAAHASAEHRSRLAEIDARRSETEQRRAEVAAAASRLTDVARAVSRLEPPVPPAMPRPSPSLDDLDAQHRALEDSVAGQLSRKGALGERLRRAEQALDEVDRARAALAELTRLHAEAATASSLATLADDEADARTERCLAPLSQALARRWSEMFVGSSRRPRLAGGGSIELGVGSGPGSGGDASGTSGRGTAGDGIAIPYSSFSGGEKTLASLLTRLLFVTSATALDCMWLDEPLEHLDPANRTKVAHLLSQVCRPGRHMRQVLVTTYEEGLARRLAERDESASILYVSTDELL
jgi:DNA repair exonuclease SbcCD ATPase subunit